MRPAHELSTRIIVVTLSLMIAAGIPVAAKQDQKARRVQLVEPFEQATFPVTSSLLGFKFAGLAKIDPEHPLADDTASQMLSLFGREDLIAGNSDDYKSTNCAPLTTPADAITEIRDKARKTSIVIINESHERSQHRDFIAEVARALRPLGFNTLAIETLSNSPSGTPEQFLPLFVRQPDLPYFGDGDGFYLSEAGFGRLGRLAKTLGYRLLSYENNKGTSTQTMTRDERIAFREEEQAGNLASFVKEHPMAKLLVHVGYSHAAEVPQADGARWMAARLKQKTGIDPLTISQTTCRGGSDRLRLAALPTSEPAGTYDLIVDHPEARFVRHRPGWRKLAGDQAANIPRKLRPVRGWRVIEARPVGEPVTSVPIDRVAIRPGEDIPLMLPPGRYHLRIIDPPTAATKLQPASTN